MKGTHDLRHGVLWKQILLFALPIAATSMLQQLFNSADVAVVGQFSAQKELALAAVGSTSSIVNLYITIFTGLAVGANVVIARLIGAEEEGEVRKAVHTSLVVAVLCGAVLMVVGGVSGWTIAAVDGYPGEYHPFGPPVSANLPAGRHIPNGV